MHLTNLRPFPMCRQFLLSSAILAAALGLSSCTSRPGLPEIPVLGKSKAPEATVDFHQHIKPILEARCLKCHNSRDAKRGLNLETRDSANNSWRGGPVIVAGEPESSMLYQVLMLMRDSTTPVATSKPHELRYTQRKLIHNWIEEGAYWPEGEVLAAE